MMNKFGITTSISYANGAPHVGHAYEALLADAIARYRRDQRVPGSPMVYFQTGTDEHGLKVARSAEARGITPQQHVDEISAQFREMNDRLGVSYDRFIRTTEDDNRQRARNLWSDFNRDDLRFGQYEGWYSVREECFVSEKEAAADKTGLEWKVEETYFFKLENYRQAIIAHIEANPTFIIPASSRNEVLGMLRDPLPDLSISRTNFSWGVKVPNHPEHVMYVWVDALSNYAVNTDFWPSSVHVIGKDIVKFHAIYWLAFLMSAQWELPKQILVHGFLTHNGVKMSKSLGNVVDPLAEIDRIGVDALRYYLLRSSRLGADADYRDDGPLELFNAELSNTIGNVAHRVTSQIHKNCGGVIPKPDQITEDDILLDKAGGSRWDAYHSAFRRGTIYHALEEVVGLAFDLNAYVQTQAPWTVRKTDPARADTILFYALHWSWNIAQMLKPIIPEGAERLLNSLGNGTTGSITKTDPAFPRAEIKNADA